MGRHHPLSAAAPFVGELLDSPTWREVGDGRTTMRLRPCRSSRSREGEGHVWQVLVAVVADP